MATVQNNLDVSCRRCGDAVPLKIAISTHWYCAGCAALSSRVSRSARVESPICGIERDPDQSNHGPEAQPTQPAYKEPIVSTLQIVARNPRVLSKKGFRAQFDDNPHLDDPRVRFAEEMFVSYEQEIGDEGDRAGFLECIELWSKVNSSLTV
jgi:hypothetical protein